MTSLQCFANISLQILQDDKTVNILKSSQKGLFKNIQDRISRTKGSQDFQKRKTGAGHPVKLHPWPHCGI